MSNEEAYAGGLLRKALDPATQPQAIRSFLSDELALVRRLLPKGCRAVDFGCGMGRHLIELRDHLARGVGFDYERASIAEAARRGAAANLHFFVADARAVPLAGPFDAALCLTNTWGTMSGKRRVLDEMRRVAPGHGSRLLTVYAETSVAARSEWYANMGHRVLRVTDREVVAEGGFTSEHFSEARLRDLLGACELHAIGDVALVARC